MSILEWIASLLGVMNVGLIIRRSIWNFPVGIVMVLLYGYIFFGAKLYSDAFLQIYFLLMQAYGWWAWTRHKGVDEKISVEILSREGRLITAASVIGVALALGYVMATWTDAALPWWDASIAALSVTAQLLMSWRKLENWLLWIAADIIGIGVYCAKGLYPTTMLYALFLVMAIFGWRQWSRARTMGQPT